MSMNADFDLRALVHANTLTWTPSPMAGVERRMLDRVGGEVARATSLVRYAPKSAFSPHTHGGGEEFLVLEGTFSDEHGEYPAGTYVRNPPTTRHQPRVEDGCIIFVKLWQFHPEDRTSVALNTHSIPAQNPADRPGVTLQPLHQDAVESVRIETWAPGAEITLDARGGLELLVLDGGFIEHSDALTKNSWLRLPDGCTLSAHVGDLGARVWIKTGHLREIRVPVLQAAS